MRVFNSSPAQHYAHHDLDIGPGFTEIPAHREESVKALVAKYPHHLSDGGVPPKEVAAQVELNAAQAKEIALLKVENDKLRKLLLEEPSKNDEKAVANRRADDAEDKCAQAERRIVELTEERNGAATVAQQAQERIAELEARVAELEAAAVPASDQAPAAAAPDSQPVGEPVKPEKAKRNR